MICPLCAQAERLIEVIANGTGEWDLTVHLGRGVVAVVRYNARISIKFYLANSGCT